MPAPSLKEKLINKLKETDDPVLLEEISNLLELQEPDTVYQTTPSQKKAIDTALQQVKNNQIIDDKQADQEADKWLSE